MSRPPLRKVLDCANPLAAAEAGPPLKAPGDWRSPRRCRAERWFMAPSVPSVRCVPFLLALLACACPAEEIFMRANQVGYATQAPKLAIAFSKAPLPSAFTLFAEDDRGRVCFRGKASPITNAVWGQFTHHAELDFSRFRTPGRYVLKLGDAKSFPFQIGDASSA